MTLHFSLQAHICSLRSLYWDCIFLSSWKKSQVSVPCPIATLTEERFSDKSFAKGNAEQQLHRASSSHPPCWSELFHSGQKYAQSLQSKQAERPGSRWVVKSLAPIFMAWKNTGRGGLEGTGGDGDKVIPWFSVRNSLRKLRSFVSHFSGPSRKTLVFRRAVVRRAVSHLARSFFAGRHGGTSRV